MMVKCGINGEDLQENEILVCHHCGMPVCRTHGWIAPSDDAFAEAVEALPDRPHGAPQPVTGRPAAARPAPGPDGSTLPSAVHCRDCADRFHRKASRRSGRTDSRLRPGGVVPVGQRGHPGIAGPAAPAGQP